MPEHPWEILADLEEVAQYNPTVRAVGIKGERTLRAGAQWKCDLRTNGKVVNASSALRWPRARP